MSQNMKIHPTAFVDPRAELDPSVEVGPYSIIGPSVRIKKGTRLLSHVVIEGHTEIGEDNVIHLGWYSARFEIQRRKDKTYYR